MTASTPAARFGLAHVVVTIVLGLGAAWFLFDGVSSLISFPDLLAQVGADPADVPWVPLWVGAAQPVVLFVAAVLLARRLPLARYALVLIVALAVIAAARLSLIAVATNSLFVLVF